MKTFILFIAFFSLCFSLVSSADDVAMSLSCDSSLPDVHLKTTKRGDDFSEVTLNGDRLDATITRAKSVKGNLEIRGKTVRNYEVAIPQGTLKFLVPIEDQSMSWDQEASLMDSSGGTQTFQLDCLMTAPQAE